MNQLQLFSSVMIVFASATAFGAIPRAQAPLRTVEALAMPLGNRLSILREQGPEGYKNLVRVMDDSKQTMEMRWRAVTAIGRIGGDDSKPELEKALVSREWYLRNAGLIAMATVDSDAALSWARRLLSDKALMVRMAAVETIAKLRDVASNQLLWKKLYSSENFRGKQSLFIRRRIAETLASLEMKGTEAKFVELLQDKDATLHAPAIAALERLTSRRLGTTKDTTLTKRERWLGWWKTNGTKDL